MGVFSKQAMYPEDMATPRGNSFLIQWLNLIFLSLRHGCHHARRCYCWLRTTAVYSLNQQVKHDTQFPSHFICIPTGLCAQHSSRCCPPVCVTNVNHRSPKSGKLYDVQTPLLLYHLPNIRQLSPVAPLSFRHLHCTTFISSQLVLPCFFSRCTRKANRATYSFSISRAILPPT